MSEDRHEKVGQEEFTRVVLGGGDRTLRNETSRSIRKVMEVIEKYTNYDALDEDVRCVVRDTVLNQINRLVRISKTRQTMVFNDGERR